MQKLFLFLLFALIVGACQKQEKSFVLKGNLEGIDEGKVFLADLYSEKKDSADLKAGLFEFKGSVDVPTTYLIYVKGKRSRKHFYVENSKMSFTAHVDSLEYAQITGSEAQAEADEIAKKTDMLYGDKGRVGLFAQYNAATDVNEKKRIESLFEIAYEQEVAGVKQYIREHPKSYVAANMLPSIVHGLEAGELEGYLNGFDASLKDYLPLAKLKDYAEKLKQVSESKIAPDFTQNDVDGNPVKLSDVYKKSELLLVDFWASWCGPCRQENPNVAEAYEKFKDKGFDVLGVSLDKNKEKWLEAIEKDKLSWTQVSDLKFWDNEVAKLYAVRSIPGNFLIAKDGKIVAKNLKGEDLHKKLEELLTNLN